MPLIEENKGIDLLSDDKLAQFVKNMSDICLKWRNIQENLCCFSDKQ